MRHNTPAIVVSFAAAAMFAGTAAADVSLTLPEGFTATVVQEGLGTGRHLVVAQNGDVYLAGRNGLVAMRDSDGNGTLDRTEPFGDVKGTEVRLFKNWLSRPLPRSPTTRPR